MMLEVTIVGDHAWPDLRGREVIHLGNNAPALRIAGLPGGTTSGRPSVMLAIELPDGRVVVAETTMRLFLTAADALRARYGEHLGDA